MKKRLFLYTTLILFAGLLSYFAASVYMTYMNSLSFAKAAVTETAQICANLYSDGASLASFAGAGRDTRITVIAPDGSVLADSRPLDVNTLENHLTRPEVQAAANGAPATFVRYSGTVGANMIYHAIKVNSGDSYVFIRTALPVANMDAAFFNQLPQLSVLLAVVALLCFLFARSMIERIIKPFEQIERKLRLLAAGEYVPGDVPGSFEEIRVVTRSIDEIAGIIQAGYESLRDEKAKLDYILDHIGDGLFVLDENRRIVLVNTAALGIFSAPRNITDKNLYYLSNDPTIAAAVDTCIADAKSAEFDWTFRSSIYSVAVKRLPETPLTMVALSEVTENRESTKRREEFFANASHELKTPLTAIKGFNELTGLNNRDEALGKYIAGIARETDRMLSLIGDMLKLSSLENAREINPVSVSLAAVAGEVRETLSAAISDKSLAFEILGDAEITAERGHVYDLVKNLAENAVRYTGTKGEVFIKIESDKNTARLVVSDNGMGISPDEQARIFERFYRAEKSRSQRNGGTGLGLAIVKHICVLYGWNLTLKSKPGVGTDVTVVFGAKR